MRGKTKVARKGIRSGIWILREIGRMVGQMLTMMFGAAALGGVIAGMTIVAFTAVEPGGVGSQVFADVNRGEDGDHLVEVRSVSVRRARETRALERADECSAGAVAPR